MLFEDNLKIYLKIGFFGIGVILSDYLLKEKFSNDRLMTENKNYI